jgi:glucose-6-phosphate 1-dehydrogenase
VTTAIDLRSKKAGEEMTGASVELVAPSAVEIEMTPYERLLGDAMNGDPMLFGSENAVEASWRVVDPILDTKVRVLPYQKGAWGPKEATRITAKNGGWHDPVESSTTAGRPA